MVPRGARADRGARRPARRPRRGRLRRSSGSGLRRGDRGAHGDDRGARPRRRRGWGVRPAYRRVDSCAGEVEARSNYFYSTWGEADEARPHGDGRASSSSARARTGSARGSSSTTAASTPRRLPRARLRGRDGQLQPGDRLDRLRHVRPPLLRAARRRGGARGLRARAAGRRRDPVRRPDAAQARARDRGGRLPDPRHAVRRDRPRRGPRALRRAARRARRRAARRGGSREASERRPSIAPSAIGYPVLVRPSYVLGGRAMRVCYDERGVAEAMRADAASRVLVDRFLEDAIEIDVDALCDGQETYVAAVMEHVEEAGVHSGDSSCVLPAPSLDPASCERDRATSVRAARARRSASSGLLNVQLARRRRRGLRARGEPARVAHGAVREQGDRRQPRRRRLPARRRRAPGRPRPAADAAAGAGQRQGGRAAVRALPRAPTRCSGPRCARPAR